MKTYSEAEIAAFADGTAMVAAAVFIDGPSAFRVWTGNGPLTFEADGASSTFTGIGQYGLLKTTGGQLGGAAQGVELGLTGVDPKVLELVPLAPWHGAPAVIWRLTFNGTGSTLLGAHVHVRGRVLDLWRDDTPGDASTLNCRVEGAARTAGRARGRMRSDPDQRLILGTDGGFKKVSHAGQIKLYTGAERPFSFGGGAGGVRQPEEPFVTLNPF